MKNSSLLKNIHNYIFRIHFQYFSSNAHCYCKHPYPNTHNPHTLKLHPIGEILTTTKSQAIYFYPAFFGGLILYTSILLFLGASYYQYRCFSKEVIVRLQGIVWHKIFLQERLISIFSAISTEHINSRI